MPRFPDSASSAQGLSDRVFGQLVARSQGKHVFPLHVGDTYREPIEGARSEAQKTRDTPRLHNYAPVHGEPVLLDAILDKVKRRAGVELDRECVQVMAGATGGLGVVATALLEPGDRVILPAPFWPLVRGIFRYRGAEPVEVPFYTELSKPGFDPVKAVADAIDDRTVAMYLNSPHNPTGVVLDDELAGELGTLARKHNLWVLSDEVYEDVYYTERAPTPLWTLPQLRDRTIAAHSVSKGYGLAGARVGYVHGPAQIMEVIRGVQTFFSYCAPRPMQFGAAHALTHGDRWLDEARRDYREAARLSTDTLGLPMPAGGTFLFFEATPHMRKGETLMEFLERCLDAGVMLTPGSASGVDYDQWARLCFTSVGLDELRQALSALEPIVSGA